MPPNFIVTSVPSDVATNIIGKNTFPLQSTKMVTKW